MSNHTTTLDETEEKIPLKPAEIKQAILGFVNSQGRATDDEIVAHLTEVDEVPERQIRNLITGLNRNGFLTRHNNMSPWEVTGGGRDAMEQLARKAVAPLIIPYGQYTPVEATYVLLAPSLGPITGPGGEGQAHFPRLQDGRIIFYGGWVRAAFMKALATMDALTLDVVSGKLKNIPMASWSHVTFSPIIFPIDTPTEIAVRRPVNTRGEAVGEIIHEALPIGVTMPIRGTFPMSHYPAPMLRKLCEQAGAVGFSPAGSGRGGHWGVGELVSLTIDGKDV